MKRNPNEYKMILAWGEALGFTKYYIQSQQFKAAEEGAPLDAIYYRPDMAKWICVSDLSAGHWFRERIKGK